MPDERAERGQAGADDADAGFEAGPDQPRAQAPGLVFHGGHFEEGDDAGDAGADDAVMRSVETCADDRR